MRVAVTLFILIILGLFPGPFPFSAHLSMSLFSQACAQGEMKLLGKWPLKERYINLEAYGGGHFSYTPKPVGYIQDVGKRLFFQLQTDPSSTFRVAPSPLEGLLTYDPTFEAPPLFVVSPSGKMLLVSKEDGTRVYSLPGGTLLGQIAPKSVYGAAWSPDEKKIAVTYGDRALWLGDLRGSFRKVAEGVFKEYWKASVPLSWSADGSTILVHGNLTNLNTGQVQTIPAPTGEFFALYPDGKKILSYGAEMVSNDERNRIFIIDAGTWKKTELPVRGRKPSLSPDGKWILICTGATSWNNGEVTLVTGEGLQRRKLADGWDPQWMPGSPGRFLFLSREYTKNPRTGITFQEILALGSIAASR